MRLGTLAACHRPSVPHFVVDCSPDVLDACPPGRLLAAIHEEAVAAGLFAEADIKVRLRPFEHFSVAGGDAAFVHVFAHIMEGQHGGSRRRAARGAT